MKEATRSTALNITFGGDRSTGTAPLSVSRRSPPSSPLSVPDRAINAVTHSVDVPIDGGRCKRCIALQDEKRQKTRKFHDRAGDPTAWQPRRLDGEHKWEKGPAVRRGTRRGGSAALCMPRYVCFDGDQ